MLAVPDISKSSRTDQIMLLPRSNIRVRMNLRHYLVNLRNPIYKKDEIKLTWTNWVWEQERMLTPELSRSVNTIDVVSYTGLFILQIKTLSSRPTSCLQSQNWWGRDDMEWNIWFLRKNTALHHIITAAVEGNVCAQRECGWEKHHETRQMECWGAIWSGGEWVVRQVSFWRGSF